MLWELFGPKRDEVTGTEGDCVLGSFIVRTAHHILCGWSDQEEGGGRDIWHVWGRWERRARSSWGNLREKGHLEDLGLDGSIILNVPLINRMVVGWIDLVRYTDKLRALVNAVVNLKFPWNAVNFLTSWGTVSFSTMIFLCGVSALFVHWHLHYCSSSFLLMSRLVSRL